jgi:hyperosmotically inducible periplasmic protein
MQRKCRVKAMMLLVYLPAAVCAAQAQTRPTPKHTKAEEAPQESLLVREVRHQLLVLPFNSVFDNLLFTMEGDKVILSGQVVRPSLKKHAEAAVKSIEGVGSVDNRIEVLPTSAADNDLRRTVYRAIFEDSVLSRYAIQALPPIHIIVKTGKVSLEGSVESEGDKNLAAIRAGSVANVLGVTNNLVVHGKENASR